MRYLLNGSAFTWDAAKAARNLTKHGVAFTEACEIFDDPFYRMEPAGPADEERWLIIGYSAQLRMLAVVGAAPEDDAWRIISARPATPAERQRYEEDDPD